MKSIHKQLIMLLALGALMAMPAVLLANGVERAAPIAGVMIPSQLEPPQGSLMIRLTDQGIMRDATSTEGGFYIVTVRNDTSDHRGIRLTGDDLAGSPFVRYTTVLAPGQSETFGWFFTPDSSTRVVDLLDCRPAATTCAVADIGNMSAILNFG